MKAIHILDRFLREGTNAISYLQVIQNDFARLESETQRGRFRSVTHFDEFTGKAVEGAWDSVETDTCDSHRRENSIRVICEYFERDTGH